MKATVHYWDTDGEEHILTLETEESEQFTTNKAVEVVPNSAHVEHVETSE